MTEDFSNGPDIKGERVWVKKPGELVAKVAEAILPEPLSTRWWNENEEGLGSSAVVQTVGLGLMLSGDPEKVIAGAGVYAFGKAVERLKIIKARNKRKEENPQFDGGALEAKAPFPMALGVNASIVAKVMLPVGMTARGDIKGERYKFTTRAVESTEVLAAGALAMGMPVEATAIYLAGKPFVLGVELADNFKRACKSRKVEGEGKLSKVKGALKSKWTTLKTNEAVTARQEKREKWKKKMVEAWQAGGELASKVKKEVANQSKKAPGLFSRIKKSIS